MAETVKSPIAPKTPPDQKGKPKHRSPNYPAIGLRKAVERLDEMYKEYRRHWVPIGNMQAKWGYKEHSGAGNQIVAAIKSYGLIDVQGDGKDRQLKVSDAGWRIAESHKDRAELLKTAATAPSLHAELWKKYGQEGVPPDDVLRHYLKFERSFNPESVDPFIAQFRDTIAFSNLNSSDKVAIEHGSEDEGEDEADEMNAVEEKADPKARAAKGGAPGGQANDAWDGPKMEIDLPRGNKIQIRLRSKVTPAEFEKIKRVYELSELSFVDNDDAETE